MYDASVIITTVCRESLKRAVRSIFRQNFSGTIQILIGVDVDLYGCAKTFQKLFLKECPKNIFLTWLQLPYSTSQRHGGPHSCFFGGSLRTALAFLANSETVIFLDDDDWFHPDHVGAVCEALKGNAWAFSYSIYADGNTGEGLCVDELESVGVGKGVFAEREGGFVRPSGLALNKLKVADCLYALSMGMAPLGDGEDRILFALIKERPHQCTERATVYYVIDPRDGMHAARLNYMAGKGVLCTIQQKSGSVREVTGALDAKSGNRSLFSDLYKFARILIFIFMFFVILLIAYAGYRLVVYL